MPLDIAPLVVIATLLRALDMRVVVASPEIDVWAPEDGQGPDIDAITVEVEARRVIVYRDIDSYRVHDIAFQVAALDGWTIGLRNETQMPPVVAEAL